MTSVRAIRDTEPSVSLVERLLAAGLISEDQLQLALREKQTHDEPLGQILVRLGMISEGVLRETLGKLLGEYAIDLRSLVPDRDALAMVPKAVARRHSMVPVGFDANARLLTLAVTDSFDVAGIDEIFAILDSGVDIETKVARKVDVKFAIRKFYEYELSIPAILQEIDTDDTGDLDVAVETEAYSHPLIRLVDAILSDAVKHDASIVHFEPEHGFFRVRYRIDGVLRQMMALHRDYWPGMAVRLRSMAGMKTAKGASPMEGRFTLRLGTRLFEFRIACQPTTQGESLVARILEQDRDVVPLENLGFESEALTSLRLMIARPEGLIVVAGAADSGKATTLCSMLSYRSDESVSIVTLEDPIKYRMTMIRQTSLGLDEGRSSAKTIQSMMRQDADVMLVGGLGDKDAADMVFRATLTGRQVFTTLEARSALAALTRLLDSGVNPEIMAGNIIGIVSQRLVRKLCRNCRQPYVPEKVERQLLGVNTPKALRLYREGACEACNFLGYKGRIGIFEVLRIDEELDEMIARAATRREISQYVIETGFKNLAEDAIRHVLAGTTSLSEASRVVDLTARLSG